MTPFQLNSFCAVVLAACATAVGCSRPVEETAPVAAAPAVTTAASPEPMGALNALSEAAAKTQAEIDSVSEITPAAEEREDVAAPQAVYQPPFPERIELFVPPKRQGGMVLTEGGTEEAVELLGFVKLDKPQVVLSINGQVTSIFEGGSQYGIDVISIQQPKVVLQRGRQRWQASLEN